MIKKLLIIFICSLILLPATVKADTADQIRQELKNLQQQINSNRTLLDQKSKEASSLQSQIAVFDSQIRDSELQITKTEVQIADLKNQISQKEQELIKQKKDLAETMVVMYESGGQQSMIEIIASSSNLTDIVNKSQYLESLKDKINTTVDEIGKLKQDLETKKKETEELLSQQENYKQGLAGQRQAKNSLLSQTKGEEAAYQNVIAQKKAEFEKSTAELNRLESSAIGVAGSYPVPFWPMRGRISAVFGACGCEAYFCGKCHTGIDIVAPALTDIKAAKDGTVTSVVTGCDDFGSYSCGGGYGNHVRVRHDDGFISIYGHMSGGTVRVSVGQRVDAGLTVLGQEGSSGYSTGYHLHFEIRNPSGTAVGAALP